MVDAAADAKACDWASYQSSSASLIIFDGNNKNDFVFYGIDQYQMRVESAASWDTNLKSTRTLARIQEMAIGLCEVSLGHACSPE